MYGFTSDCSLEGLLALASKLKYSYNSDVKKFDYTLIEEDATKTGNVVIARESKDVALGEKIAYLKIVDEVIEGYDKRIIQRIVSISDKTQYVTIANTKGKFIKDIRNQQRISAQVVAKDKDKTQSIKVRVSVTAIHRFLYVCFEI